MPNASRTSISCCVRLCACLGVRVLRVSLLLCGPVLAGDSLLPQVDLWTTTGERISGQLMAIDARQITLREGEQDRSVSPSEVWQVAFPPSGSRPTRPQFWIYLNNGDRWGVSVVKLVAEELEFQRTPDEPPQTLGIQFVSGIQPLRPRTSWRTDEPEWLQVANRKAKSDLVVLRNGDHQTGEISDMGDMGVQLTGSLGVQELKWATVSGLLLNPDLAEVPPPTSEGWTVLLRDESWITVSAITLTDDGICHLTPTHGIEQVTPLENVRWMSHWGTTAMPLSRTLIATQNHQPLLGETMEVALDRNVLGLPLRSDLALGKDSGTAVELPSLSPLGIGLASGMTVQWKLDGTSRGLLCGLSLDTTACEAGQAIVKFKVDNQLSKEIRLRAGEPLVLETAIDLSGAGTLTIETEFDENGDACDWINLITPVLVK